MKAESVKSSQFLGRRTGTSVEENNKKTETLLSHQEIQRNEQVSLNFQQIGRTRVLNLHVRVRVSESM